MTARHRTTIRIFLAVASLAVIGLTGCGGPTANGGPIAGQTTTEGLQHATTTLLPDGRVLAAGGSREGPGPNALSEDSNAPIGLRSAWLFEPATGGWFETGSMTQGRSGHTATLLADGRVLAVGGCDFGIPGNTYESSGQLDVFSAEIYDPPAGQWRATGSLAFGRCHHTATLLPDGRVLVVGGWLADPCGFPEVFDPTSGTWAVASQLRTPRFDHTATLLSDGTVMIAGGRWDVGPPTPSDLCVASGGAPRAEPGSTIDGIVVELEGGAEIEGGHPELDTIELYDPETGRWTSGSPMSGRRSGATATPLADGRVLVAGGFYAGMLKSADIYDPATGSWTPAAPMTTGRSGHAAIPLHDGAVLVVGGCFFDHLVSTERYDPVHDTWQPTAPMPMTHCSPPVVILPDGKGLLAFDPRSQSTATYDPATDTWVSAKPEP